MSASARHSVLMLLIVALVGATACSTARTPPRSSLPPPMASSPTSGLAFPTIMLDTDGQVQLEGTSNAVDSTPSQLQRMPANAHTLVWLGGYDNAACQLVTSDSELRDQFTRYKLAADRRVIGYFLADEPNTAGNCPSAPEQVRARSALVRSLDPDQRRITLANIDDPNQFPAFRESADVLSTDPYPCTADSKKCDTSLIPRYIGALRAAGVTRYMGMVQAFSGDNWRWPTAAELRTMLEQWRNSEWCGMLIFSWSYQTGRLRDHPDLMAVLHEFNANLPSAPDTCA